MRIDLLSLAAGVFAITACSQPRTQGSAAAGMGVDTIIRRASSATRDTIIKNAAGRDTIIKHAGVVPDRCKKVPRPPDCPPPLMVLKADTIIR